MSSLEDPRNVDARSKTRRTERSTTGGQSRAVVVRQKAKKESEASQELVTSGEKITIRYSPTTLQVLFGMQRVACAGVAVWDYTHTRDFNRFLLLLAAGQIDLVMMKEVIVKVLSDFLAKYINKESAEP